MIEQTGKEKFNRGALMNIGFLEANKVDNFDCFVFHDVDSHMSEADRLPCAFPGKGASGP